MTDFHARMLKQAFIPGEAGAGAPPAGDPAAAGGAPPPPPPGDPAAGGAPPPPGGAPMDPAGAPMDPAAGGAPPPPEMLEALMGGAPEGEAEPDPNDDVSITRGQADFVMDIVERTMASIGKGKTKSQQESEFEFEQKQRESEAEAEAAAPPEGAEGAPPGGPVTGIEPGTGPGVAGAPMDPAAFGQLGG